MTTDAQWGQRLKGMSTEDVMHAALQAIDELQRRGADASATTLARARSGRFLTIHFAVVGGCRMSP
jgi:hypothetical protein